MIRKQTQTDVNDTETLDGSRRELTRPRSRPVRLELIDKDGKACAWAETPHDLILFAERMWPGMEQDEDRTGRGWTIQPVGADIVWQRSPLGPVKV